MATEAVTTRHDTTRHDETLLKVSEELLYWGGEEVTPLLFYITDNKLQMQTYIKALTNLDQNVTELILISNTYTAKWNST